MCVLACVACSSRPPVEKLTEQLVRPDSFVFQGGFVLPDDQFGVSSVNWTEGVMEVHEESLYFIGNEQEDSIAEFGIPALGIGLFPDAGRPGQGFQSIFDRLRSNNENLDQVLGMELHDGRLFLNVVEYYDAPADNRLTTIVIEDPDNLDVSAVSGPYSMRGRARAAGWLSPVPIEWRNRLGCTHISGSSSGGPIISRYSVGPSAFCVNLRDFAGSGTKNVVASRELLGFSLNNPLHADLFNESGRNDVWTHLSHATYGFVIPGTTTYATFGNSGGHKTGVGYKLRRSSGDTCGGYCAKSADDMQHFFWFWDMRDLWLASAGRKAPSAIVPYAWGEWPLPDSVPSNGRIGGASFDASSGLLYLSLLDTGYGAEEETNPPVIIVYSIAI